MNINYLEEGENKIDLLIWDGLVTKVDWEKKNNNKKMDKLEDKDVEMEFCRLGKKKMQPNRPCWIWELEFGFFTLFCSCFVGWIKS